LLQSIVTTPDADDCSENCVDSSYETLDTYVNGFFSYYSDTLWVEAFLVGAIGTAGLITCATTGFLPACGAAVVGIPLAIELTKEANESGRISGYLFNELGTLQPGEVTTISLQNTSNGIKLKGGNTSYGLDVKMPVNTFVLKLFTNP